MTVIVVDTEGVKPLLQCVPKWKMHHFLEATISAMPSGHQKYIPGISEVYKKYVRNDIAVSNLEFYSEQLSGFGSNGGKVQVLKCNRLGCLHKLPEPVSSFVK